MMQCRIRHITKLSLLRTLCDFRFSVASRLPHIYPFFYPTDARSVIHVLRGSTAQTRWDCSLCLQSATCLQNSGNIYPKGWETEVWKTTHRRPSKQACDFRLTPNPQNRHFSNYFQILRTYWMDSWALSSREIIGMRQAPKYPATVHTVPNVAGATVGTFAAKTLKVIVRE